MGSLLARLNQNYLRLEQRAGNPPRDRHEVALVREYPHQRGLPKLRQVDSVAMPDLRQRGRVRGYCRKLGKDETRMDKKVLDNILHTWSMIRLGGTPGATPTRIIRN